MGRWTKVAEALAEEASAGDAGAPGDVMRQLQARSYDEFMAALISPRPEQGADKG